MARESTAERFWGRVNKTGPIPEYRPDLEACWLWGGQILQDSGYGRVFLGYRWIDGRRRQTWARAHRYSFELLVGPIPEGLTLDHLCRVRHCVNPAHLEPVTIGVNVLRGFGPGALSKRKTHCLRGHPFDTENTLYCQGFRYCRACMRLRRRRAA